MITLIEPSVPESDRDHHLWIISRSRRVDRIEIDAKAMGSLRLKLGIAREALSQSLPEG